jgi:hypothetical protein
MTDARECMTEPGIPGRAAVRTGMAPRGRRAAAVEHLQARVQGTPVGQIGRHAVTSGVRSETIQWPQTSVGQQLVFQSLATALGRPVNINFPLQVAPE